MVNGRIPLSQLTAIPGGHLRSDAARSYMAMRSAAAKDGVTLRPAGPISSYRPYNDQVRMRNYWCGQGNCGRAAIPGTSNHGWGIAVDFYLGSGVYNWLSRNAHKYGWSHDEGVRVGEAWHWRYIGGYSAPKRDANWFLTSEERKVYNEWHALKKSDQYKKRRGVLWRWMITRRKAIWRAAQKDGWKKLNRKRRYEFFKNLTKR